MDITKRIKELPDKPGVYVMKDNAGNILYVGKAISLKKRVASYFQKQKSHTPRIQAMVNLVRDIDFIVTTGEAEALILEAGLIKEYQPKYNVAIKDGKAYPILKLTINEEYPRLLIVRRKKDDSALYFGPYTNAGLLREAHALMRRVFPLRTCRNFPNSACLNYHLNLCTAPCVKKIDRITYQEIVKELILFLQGKKAELINKLNKDMQQAAASQKFETAIELRNRLEALTSVVTKTVIYEPGGPLAELKKLLNLEKLPVRIEAYDISNISGRDAVGAMVCFVDGCPAKNYYRRFKINTVSGSNDYKMLQEVIERRFKHEWPLPDLVIVDGGKGQISAVYEKLKQLNLQSVPAIGIAKQFEYIYLPNRPHPVMLPLNSQALKLIQRIRDAAHCFAINYHHNLRERLLIASQLDKIYSIGPKKKQALLTAFNSITDIKKATKKQLQNIRCIDAKASDNIRQYFKKHKGD